MSSAWAWLKKWGGILFGGIATLLLLAIGGGWLWRKKEAELAQVRDQLAIEAATSKVKALRAERSQLGERVDEKSERAGEIDVEIKANHRKIVEAHHGMDGLSDAEVDDALTQLGF